MKGLSRSAAAAAGLLLAAGEGSSQCALCREAVETGAREGLVRGFVWSYLLLILPAFLLPGLLAWGILRARRAARSVDESDPRLAARAGPSHPMHARDAPH